jgi:rSAM/selenodomain-associated transferase 2
MSPRPDRPTPPSGSAPWLSVVVPTLNEEEGIAATLGDAATAGVEIVVVDGGSEDGTVAAARGHADRILETARGRAAQMNAGVAACPADVLLFLHADTALPDDADRLVQRATRGAFAWGRFDVRIDSERTALRVVGAMMNLRSRCTGIATGDQALFVRHELFRRVGGFPDLPLMEDIALCRLLKRHGRPACLDARVTTSARRWERHGVWRTIVLMWRLRAAYFFGADPRELALRYGYRPR